MKFCGNCGEKIENDDAKFCKNCGQNFEAAETPSESADTQQAEAAEMPSESADTQPVEAAETPSENVDVQQFNAADNGAPAASPKKKKPAALWWALGGGVVIIAVIAVVLVVSGVFASPAKRFKEIQQAAFDSFKEALTQKKDTDTELSTDLTLTMNVETDSPYMATVTAIAEQFSVDMNFDVNVKENEQKSLFGLTVNYAGSKLLTGMIVNKDDKIGMYVPTLDSNYYTMDMQAFSDLMAESMGTAGGISSMGSIGVNQVSFTNDELKSLIDTYSKILLSAVNSNNVTSSKESLSMFDGEREVSCTVYTFTPSEDDLRKMLKAFSSALENDNILIKAFKNSGTTDEEWDDIIAELNDSIDETAKTIADGNFSWSIAMEGKQMVMEEISFDDESGEALFMVETYDEGKKGSNTWVTIKYEGTDLVFRSEYTVDKTNVDGTASVSVSDDYSGTQTPLTMTYSFDTDKTSIIGVPYGTYQFEISDEYGPVFNADLDVAAADGGGTNHAFSISGPILNAYQISNVGLNLYSTDKPSTITEPTQTPVDLSDADMQEIQAIFENMTMELQEVLYGLFSY